MTRDEERQRLEQLQQLARDVAESDPISHQGGTLIDSWQCDYCGATAEYDTGDRTSGKANVTHHQDCQWVRATQMHEFGWLEPPVDTTPAYLDPNR
jgi:hypothetical protein